MDIEVIIKVGTRKVHDDGSVEWLDQKTDRHLVTYVEDKAGAAKEAIAMSESSLNKLLK